MKKILIIVLPIILIFLSSLYLFLKDDLELDLLFQKPYQKTPQEIQKAKERAEKYLYNPLDEDLAKELKAPWKYCGKGIYFNPETLKIEGDEKTAWFRVFRARDRELTVPDTEQVKAAFEDIKIEIWCSNDALYMREEKYYNQNKKLLKSYTDDSTITPSYRGFVDGEIYYNAMCK